MTLFRPICLMPVTIRNSSDNIVKVPPLRQKTTKLESKLFKPTKSKFKQKLTSIHRRSAFCIFHPIESSAGCADTKNSAPINLARNKAQTEEIAVVVADDTSKATKTTITCNNNLNNNNNRRKRGTKLQQQQQQPQQENVIDECIASKRTKSSEAVLPKKGNLREKIRQQEKQEKEDFKLAKMLQEYDDNAHSPSSNRTIRYALRSRSKPSSSLSSSSSSIENIQNKFALLSTAKSTNKKNTSTYTTELGRTLRNGANNKTSILSFTDQKLTRSRRLALAITGA